jgi:hypothetical protein
MAGVPEFIQKISAATAVATSKASFTTAASVLDPTWVQPIPANYLKVGSRFRITVTGAISNVVTAAPTFTFQVMLGAVAVFSTGAVTTNTTANTNIPFRLVIDLRVNAIGSSTSANIVGSALLTCTAFAAGSTAITLPTTAPAAGTGFDSTVANNLDFFVACSASNAANAITIWDYMAEQTGGF